MINKKGAVHSRWDDYFVSFQRSWPLINQDFMECHEAPWQRWLEGYCHFSDASVCSIFLVYLLSASAKKPRTNHYGQKKTWTKSIFFPSSRESTMCGTFRLEPFPAWLWKVDRAHQNYRRGWLFWVPGPGWSTGDRWNFKRNITTTWWLLFCLQPW